MALVIYPNFISPATVGQPFTSEPFVVEGGTAPYTWTVTGSLPPGITYATQGSATPGQGSQLLISGKALVADQYVNDPQKSIPTILNASTFTITVTDSLLATASLTVTIPVFLFSEDEVISVYEMLRASYQVQDPTLSNYYIAMSNMGTMFMNIGEIGAMLFGSLTLILNAYLNNFTQGMHRRLRGYIRIWDQIKLISQSQENGSVDSITGLNNSWQLKRQLLLENVKTILPAFTLAEINARNAHLGGSDFTGSIAGADGGDGSLSVN